MDKRLEKFISIIKNLKEEGIVSSGPTMSTGSTAGKAGFGGSAQGFDKGPTAGFDIPLGKLDGRTKLMKRLPPAYSSYIRKSFKQE
jgi:hypothetical protein